MKRVKWLIALLMVVGLASISVAGTLDEIAQAKKEGKAVTNEAALRRITGSSTP